MSWRSESQISCIHSTLAHSRKGYVMAPAGWPEKPVPLLARLMSDNFASVYVYIYACCSRIHTLIRTCIHRLPFVDSVNSDPFPFARIPSFRAERTYARMIVCHFRFRIYTYYTLWWSRLCARYTLGASFIPLFFDYSFHTCFWNWCAIFSFLTTKCLAYIYRTGNVYIL